MDRVYNELFAGIRKFIEEVRYCNEDEEARYWFMVRCYCNLASSLDDFEIHS